MCAPLTILDDIHINIRNKRNVALDRVDFEMCLLEPNKSFDDFFIRLKQIADCDELYNCADQWMTTRVMSGISSNSLRQKLLALKPFPTMQQVVTLCRSEESAIRSGLQLSGQKVAKVKKKNFNQDRKSIQKSNRVKDHGMCKTCGRDSHLKGETCPAVGKTCSSCKEVGHFNKVLLQVEEQI